MRQRDKAVLTYASPTKTFHHEDGEFSHSTSRRTLWAYATDSWGVSRTARKTCSVRNWSEILAQYVDLTNYCTVCWCTHAVYPQVKQHEKLFFIVIFAQVVGRPFSVEKVELIYLLSVLGRLVYL